MRNALGLMPGHVGAAVVIAGVAPTSLPLRDKVALLLLCPVLPSCCTRPPKTDEPEVTALATKQAEAEGRRYLALPPAKNAVALRDPDCASGQPTVRIIFTTATGGPASLRNTSETSSGRQRGSTR